MKTIEKKEEEIDQENLRLKKWTEDDDNEMGNIRDPYNEL